MKTITLFIIYFVVFVLFYLGLSLFGILLSGTTTYLECIHSHEWFLTYTLIFGWWLALFPTREYWLKHEDYFNTVFK